MNELININAILPMRAGSQRVKGKNERIINGKYLYEYIVDTLLHAKLVGNIIINTDITSVSNKYSENKKIIIIERSDHLTGNCNMNNVIDDTLKHTDKDIIIQVHATNPLLKKETIDNAIYTFIRNQKINDSLFGVTKVQKRFWSEDCTPINHNFEDEPTTQNLEPYFEENSCIYIFSQESFYKNKNRIGAKPYLFEISRVEAWDIDEEEDFEIAKILLSNIEP